MMPPTLKRGRTSRPTRELPPNGKLLRTLRDNLQLSVEAAAAKVDKARDWWHRREIGIIEVTADDLRLLAKAYGVWFKTDARGTSVKP